VNIAEYPYLSNPIIPEFKYSRACVLNRSARRFDSKDLTSVRASVNKLRERLIILRNNFLDLVREIREGSLDEINVFAKLCVAVLELSE
jgi:hypothetical protein